MKQDPEPGVRMRVSVVVPAYNEEALLPKCLESLRAQDYPGEVQLLVVDNASTDGTARVARSFGATVVPEPERGYSNALIRGFAAADGDIIACTDADSIVPPDWISRLVGEYERQPDVVAIGGHIEFVAPGWKTRLLERVFIPHFNRIDRRNPAGPHLWGANMSVRRDAFLAVGGWNPRFSLQADSELSERLRTAGRVIVLESLCVFTSARRWNKSLLLNSFIYAGNWIWFHVFRVPLFRDFPIVRETPTSEVAAATGRFDGRSAAFTCAAMAVVGVAGYAAFAPWSNTFGRTYWNGSTGSRLVALTFDDGPDEPYTSRVLAILKREHVHATFFLIGSNVRRSPESVARIVREGHVVGNHSDTHPLGFALEWPSRLRRELDAAEESIHAAGGVYPLLFRPPNGLRSPWLMSLLERDSLVTVTWDDAPRDWDPVPAPELVKRTLAQAHSGAIVLLHDGLNLTPGADRSETVRALPGIIDGLRARGYGFCTVPELLGTRASLARWASEPPARRSATKPAAVPSPS